jgi:hypothetical protein
MPHQSIPASVAMEVASGYLADVLAQTDVANPHLKSRDLEEATRQLARAAYRADLSEVALVRWLGVASAAAFGGQAASVRLVRQLHVWASDEFSAAATASGRPWVSQVA